MHVLTADIERVPVVRRHVKRSRPDEPVFDARRRAVRLIRPHLDISKLPPALFVTHDDAADTARSGSGRPDDVRVEGIWSGPATLTAADGVPRRSRNHATSPTQSAVAGTTIRRPVLLVAE